MKFPYPTFAGSLACLLLSALASASVAATPAPDETGIRRQIAQVTDRALVASPALAAARAAITAAQARLAGAGLPLNNPEIEAEAEKTDVNTYRLGISQSIDWHDKRAAFEQVAGLELLLVRQEYEALRLHRARELLTTIGRISLLQKIGKLSRERTKLLTHFSRLATRRHAAGDIPRTDLQLARLSLAEANMQEARNRSALLQAGTDFEGLSGYPLGEAPELPSDPGTPSPIDADAALVEQHPDVQTALLAARVARQRIQSADRQRKADPTVGLAAGSDGGHSLLGLSFSMPLQLRNDYRSDVRAARAEALQAEQTSHQTYNNQRARLTGARARYQVIATAWKAWLETGQESLKKRLKLLDTLWEAGEISTSDYLLQLQQTLDTRITGTELQGDLWEAWVDWLAASGTLNDWLNESH